MKGLVIRVILLCVAVCTLFYATQVAFQMKLDGVQNVFHLLRNASSLRRLYEEADEDPFKVTFLLYTR